MTVLALQFVRRNWTVIAGVLAVVVFIAWFGHALYSRGVADNENKHQQATTSQLGERNATNEAVRSMSEARKCRSLGGVYRDGRCE